MTKKLQEGGFVTYRPIPITPQQVSAPQGQPELPEKKDEGLDSDVLKKMIGEGITTDVMAYSQQVNSAYQQYAMMDDNMKNSFRGRQLRLTMKGDLGQLNGLARAKKYLDASLEIADKNGALDEGAVTQDGVYVKDMSTGRIGQMSFGQYNQAKNDPDNKYKVLTNAELANEREVNPQLLGNASVFQVIKFGTGLDKIKEEVYKVLPSLGSISVTKSSGAFGGAIDGEGGEGDAAQTLEHAAASGAFKIRDGSTVQTNAPQIEKAKHDLWQGLSAGAKATLRLKAASMVADPNDIDQMAATMAAGLLDPKLTTVNKEIHDETYKKMTAAGAGKQEPVGPNELAFNFRGHNANVELTGPKGSKIQAVGSVLDVSNYQAPDGKRTSLQDATNIAKIGDVHNAFTVNGDKVDPKRTMINGKLYFTYLPIIEGSDGVQRVDEEGVAKFAALQKQTGLSPAELNKQYGAQLHLKAVVVGEAVSFSDSRIGWFDKRDPNYYTNADSQTEKYAMETIDPKHKDVSHIFGGDNTAHTHLIIMPAGSEFDFRNSDANKVYAPQSSFDVRTYNTGPNGANIDQGQPYSQPQTGANLGTGFWNQK